MDINKVIELGDKASKLNLTFGEFWSQLNKWCITVMVVMILIIIAALIIDNTTMIYINKFFCYVVPLIVIIFCLYPLNHSLIKDWDDTLTEQRVEWETEVAFPYIDSLESETITLSGVNTGLEDTMSPAFILNNDGANIQPMNIVFEKDSKIETVSGEMNVLIGEVESPEATYKYVDKDLGFELDSGYYNITITVPSGYNFN